jgi:uroporphyrinogen decarboxylase
VSLFLETARGADSARAPVWIMRQAGRYLPEYRALRERHDFWELVRTPELACQVTLQPIERFGFDAAILFSDIMTPLVAMGVEIAFAPGPVIAAPLRSDRDVAALRRPDEDEIAPYVAEAIGLIRAASRTPLIGFGGAPLTLASYLVQGGGSKDFAELRGFLRRAPVAAHALLDALTEVSIRYLRMQVRAGAQAIQLFDSWAGLHDRATYAEFGLPYNRRVFDALEELKVPRLYLAVNAGHLYHEIRHLPCETVSVDWRAPLHEVRPQLSGKVLQGNLDPAALLGPAEALVAAVDTTLRSGLGGPHIFNLGHGIFRQTDPDRVALLVDTVRAFDRRSAAQLEAATP